MKPLRIFVFLFCSLVLPAKAQLNLTLGKLDSMKTDAKKLEVFLKNTQNELERIKAEKLKIEAKAIGGDLRKNLRESFKQTAPTNEVKPIVLPTHDSPAPKNETHGNLPTPRPTPEEPEKNENIGTTKPNKPDDVHKLWAEVSKKDLERLNAEERNKENELLALKQALELQVRANEMQDLRQTNWVVGGSAVLLILLFSVAFLFRTNLVRKKTNKLLAEEKQLTEQERDKSETLLLNILPFPIAQELKTHGKAQPRQYKLASVLFTDFKGFTTVAEKMTPQELIGELDECFAKFDEIITKHHLEKIKTIGDAYMCAGGIPEDNTTNPIDAVLAGLEIQRFMEEKRAERLAQGKAYWFLRLGINSGEIVAGVIGKKKFAYDIWGDTVNSASRMESSGEVGKVNISGNTYQYIKDLFVCTYRGQIDAKGKGAVDMYFVESILPEYSVGGAGKTPNEDFWQKVKSK
jgi:class 3 adenylate cyclase